MSTSAVTQSEERGLEDRVLIERQGTAGHIRLNRPAALNSLSVDMVQALALGLDVFEADPDIATVIVSGNGGRAFCAGGDIRALYDNGPDNTEPGVLFWRTEYLQNARISRFPKPYIALMDGITMGGGVGISSHGQCRIVTPRTRLAMPETGIGFFPDVGGSWLLSHAPGEIGTYLGLTGLPIGAADAIYAGLADVCINEADLSAITEAIATLKAPASAESVMKIAASFAIPAGDSMLEQNRALIDRSFAHDAVEDILAALAAEPTEFASQTHATLLSRSPTSLKLTLRLLRLARNNATLEECLERELRAASHVLLGHDFYEGVRAAIVDKDRNPQWKPNSLEQVSNRDIESYFAPVAEPLFSSERAAQ